MLTKDQIAHLSGVKGPKDQAGLASFADRLQEDGHPLAPLFRRVFNYTQGNGERPDTYPQWAGWESPHIPEGHPLLSVGLQRYRNSNSHIPVAAVTHAGHTYEAPMRKAEIEALKAAFPGKFRASGTTSVAKNDLKEPDQLHRRVL